MAQDEYLNVIDWNQVHRDTTALCTAIAAAGVQPDLIVGIGYGGIIPATLVYFALPETRFRVAYPASSSDQGIEALSGVEGKTVLLLDDLAITGDSLLEIKRQVEKLGARKVIAAVLYCSEDYAGVDYVVRRLDANERVVFPWYCRPSDGGVHVMKFKGRFGKHEPV
jgi:hypoxanthine phosphoribosyltransferase